MRYGAGGSTAARNERANLVAAYDDLVKSLHSPHLSRVGNYELSDVVGKGKGAQCSFGTVYLATHVLTGSKVVAKAIPKSQQDGNLSREIYHHRRLRHANIATLYEVVVTELTVWLIQEYCDGGELYEYLLRHKRLGEDEARDMFAQLCAAVSYIHGRGCVHRDLKLENVFMHATEGRVKIGDFGFTRETGRGGAGESTMRTWCGTTAYSAPELLREDKYSGQKADIWSLGVMLYALLCGSLPFDDDAETEVRRRILECEPTYPQYLSSDARDMLQRVLQKSPKARISMDEILAHPFFLPSVFAEANREPVRKQESVQIYLSIMRKMKRAGVDIPRLRESIDSDACDALSGWFTLLYEKELASRIQRQHRRRASRVSTVEVLQENEPRPASSSAPSSIKSQRARRQLKGLMASLKSWFVAPSIPSAAPELAPPVESGPAPNHEPADLRGRTPPGQEPVDARRTSTESPLNPRKASLRAQASRSSSRSSFRSIRRRSTGNLSSTSSNTSLSSRTSSMASRRNSSLVAIPNPHSPYLARYAPAVFPTMTTSREDEGQMPSRRHNSDGTAARSLAPFRFGTRRRSALRGPSAQMRRESVRQRHGIRELNEVVIKEEEEEHVTQSGEEEEDDDDGDDDDDEVLGTGLEFPGDAVDADERASI